jgi:hypothetical protein
VSLVRFINANVCDNNAEAVCYCLDAPPSAPPLPPPFAPENCAKRDAKGMPAKLTLDSIKADPNSNDINSCLHLTKDDKLQYWDPAQLHLRDVLKAACTGASAVVECDLACSKFYLDMNQRSRICTSTTSGANCQSPKAAAGQGSYKLQAENDVGFCDPPSPPPSVPPSPPPVVPPPSPPPPVTPPSAPPAPPPRIVMDVDGSTGVEVLIEHNTEYEVKFTGDTVEEGDYVLFVREDFATQHSTNVCAAAVGEAGVPALSTTSDPPNHGGVVDANKIAHVHLIGVDDADDPLNTDNTSPSGTFYLCFAKGPFPGGTPTAIDYTYYDHVAIHLEHRPPSPPPLLPPPSPPPPTLPPPSPPPPTPSPPPPMPSPPPPTPPPPTPSPPPPTPPPPTPSPPPPSTPPPVSAEQFHGLANGAWQQTIEVDDKENHVIYYFPLSDNGYLEAGDWVHYVGIGMACTPEVRANYPLDQGEGQDYGGIINMDVTGALTTTVNMIHQSAMYRACYFKPMQQTPSARRKLGVVYDAWTAVDAYIHVRLGAESDFPPSPVYPPAPPLCENSTCYSCDTEALALSACQTNDFSACSGITSPMPTGTTDSGGITIDLSPPPAPLAPDQVAAWDIQMQIVVLTAAIDNDGTIPEVAILDAVEQAVHLEQPEAAVVLTSQVASRRLAEDRRQLAVFLISCGTDCNNAACATDPKTTLTYTVTIFAEEVTAQELEDIRLRIEAAIPSIKAATGGDNLCSVGGQGADYEPDYLPPPSPMAPPPATPCGEVYAQPNGELCPDEDVMTLYECRAEHDNPTSSYWTLPINVNFQAHHYNQAGLPIGCSTYDHPSNTLSKHMMYFETSDTIQPTSMSNSYKAICKRCARSPSTPVPPCEYYHASAPANSAAGECPAGHALTTQDECLAYELYLQRLKDLGKVEHQVDTRVRDEYDDPRTNVGSFPTGCSWRTSGNEWMVVYEASDSVNGPYGLYDYYYFVCKTPGACPVQPPPAPPPPSIPPPASPPPCAPGGYRMLSSNSHDEACEAGTGMDANECSAFKDWLDEDPAHKSAFSDTDYTGWVATYGTYSGSYNMGLGCNVFPRTSDSRLLVKSRSTPSSPVLATKDPTSYYQVCKVASCQPPSAPPAPSAPPPPASPPPCLGHYTKVVAMQETCTGANRAISFDECQNLLTAFRADVASTIAQFEFDTPALIKSAASLSSNNGGTSMGPGCNIRQYHSDNDLYMWYDNNFAQGVATAGNAASYTAYVVCYNAECAPPQAPPPPPTPPPPCERGYEGPIYDTFISGYCSPMVVEDTFEAAWAIVQSQSGCNGITYEPTYMNVNPGKFTGRTGTSTSSSNHGEVSYLKHSGEGECAPPAPPPAECPFYVLDDPIRDAACPGDHVIDNENECELYHAWAAAQPSGYY